MRIDLNCDMGENAGDDEAILPYITSANIACGFHAGDEIAMQRTVRLAKRYGVAVGAHPGWKDREGFGRREMPLPPQHVEALILYQVGALDAMAKAEGLRLQHVKPHGALYNQAARDKALATAIARAVKRLSPDLVLVGLAGSALIEAGIEEGLRVAREGFPDRAYHLDGTLVPRSQPHAVLESPGEIAAHALRLAQTDIEIRGQPVRLDTLCLHGDHPRAAANARQVRQALEAAGIEVVAMKK